MNNNVLKTNYHCDMHSHSNRSDGADTPKELIDRAAELGLRVIVLCDHDVIPPEFIVDCEVKRNICEYSLEKGIYLIPGIEISCETMIDDVHLVCIGCDWKDPYFAEFEAFVQRSKQLSYKMLVERIQEDGYPISWEGVLSWNEHYTDPEKIQKKMIFEVLSEIGFAPSWADAKKIVKAEQRYQIKREKPSAISVIKEVHRTGGIVILAHPYLIDDNLSLDGINMSRTQFIETLIDAGLDGIEARYTYCKTSYTGNLSDSQISEEIVKNYTNRIRIISGGSDYHGDQKKHIAFPRELGECGLQWNEFYSNKYLRLVIENIYGKQ